MTPLTEAAASGQHDFVDRPEIDLLELIRPARRQWKGVLGATLLLGALGYGVSFLVESRYTAESVLLPPQQQGAANSALASLGALSSLVGSSAGTRNSPDQYIALMRSATVSDRIIRKFGLMKEWDEKYISDARKKLFKRVEMQSNKKDSLISIDVTDSDPARAAAMANQYIEELRTLTNTLAVTEAQQRRVFFETLLKQTRDKLATAQSSLEASGYSPGALNVEPRSAAEGYAQLRASLTSAVVKLQVLRNSLADTSPEVRTQQETVNALQLQVDKMEAESKHQPGASDYTSRYREFKYEETLFELFARQYESARVDESREGALIQVVDLATPPERKSFPRRSLFAALGALIGLVCGTVFFARGARRSAAGASR